MDAHHHDAHQTRTQRKAANQANAGLWPLWLYAGLAIAFAVSMVADGRSGALTGFVLLLLWLMAYVMVPGSLIMILLCLTDTGRDGRRDVKGAVIYLIVLAISLVIAFFVAGPLRVW